MPTSCRRCLEPAPVRSAGTGAWRRRTGLAGLALVLAAAVVGGPGAGPAAAHAVLTSTTPTANELLEGLPGSVELTFDEPVEVLAGAVRVIGPGGGRADRGSVEDSDGGKRLAAAIDGDTQGTYTVAWRVLSEDGHNLSGSFVFHVGRETGAAELDDDGRRSVEIGGALGRWLGFAGMLAAVGAVVVAGLAGPGEQDASARARRLAVTGGLAGSAGVALVLVAQAAEAAGRSLPGAIGLTPDLAADTRTGTLTAARGACLLAAGVLAACRPVWRRATWLAAAPIGAAAALLALSGHAWTAERRVLAVGVDFAHILAAAVWVGGLAALLVALPVTSARRRLGQRFSTTAVAATAVLAVSGTVSALVQLGSLEALTATGYGQLLLVKIAGFVILLWFGWMNRRRLVPILERTAAPLLRSLRAEVLVAVAVLGITAVLVDQPPGRNQLSDPFTTTLLVDDVTLQVSVEPSRVGANDIHLYFYDGAGAAPAPVDAVEVTAATGDIPPRRLTVTPITASHVSAYGAALSSPGAWTFQVTAVRSGVPTAFTIEVPIR